MLMPQKRAANARASEFERRCNTHEIRVSADKTVKPEARASRGRKVSVLKSVWLK